MAAASQKTGRKGKLSSYLPGFARPFATRAGLERKRVMSLWRQAKLLVSEMSGHIRHVAGPADIRAEEYEVFVGCIVRNGMTWLPTWLDHYRELGVHHMILLDNGSTDGTQELASAGGDTSVFRCDLSYGTYLLPFARWLHQFAGNGWLLLADVDELFGYPYDRNMPMEGLIRYLNHYEYSAMVAQNLEMISATPLRDLRAPADSDLRRAYPLFERSDVTRTEDKYWRWMNAGVTSRHLSHSGGLRRTFFDWSGAMLTKTPLCKPSSSVSIYPYDNHFVTRAQIADVTGIFRHYKYIHSFAEQARVEAEREEHYNKGRIFKRYAAKLRDEPSMSMAGDTSERWSSTEELLDDGYVIAPQRYREWVANRQD